MLSAKKITYTVGDKKLLDDISLDFLPGRLNLIVGPNGAGKSTLIKVLSGQLKSTSGSVEYSGMPIDDYSIKELSRRRSVLSQHIEVAFPLTVFEVVLMGRYPHMTAKSRLRDDQICKEVMTFLDLNDFSHRNYMTLSGGEQQRVQFARVMTQIWEPFPNADRYLLLDEPLAFLDIHYKHIFMDQVKKLCCSDLVIVGVVHDLNVAVKYADYITILQKGKQYAFGVPGDVITAGHLNTVFGINVTIFENGQQRHILFE